MMIPGLTGNRKKMAKKETRISLRGQVSYKHAEKSMTNITKRGHLADSRLLMLIHKAASQYLQGNEDILEVGCGDQSRFAVSSTMTYVGTDIRRCSNANVLSDAKHLPFKERSFDVCLCFQTLEHLDDPSRVVDELYAVLKPDGIAFISVPSSWIIHGAPNDYWRWTEYGLREQLSKFHILSIEECGGPALSIIQMVILFVPRKLGFLFLVLNKLGDIADQSRMINARMPRFTTNYLAVAKKE
jgi:SAM-dependent methyltransferase